MHDANWSGSCPREVRCLTYCKTIDLSKAPGNEYNPTFGDCLKDLAQSVSHYMWTLLQSSFAMHSSTPLALCLETCFFLLSRSLGPGLPPCLVHFRHPGPDFKSIPGPTFLLISVSPWHLPPLSCPLCSHVPLFSDSPWAPGFSSWQAPVAFATLDPHCPWSLPRSAVQTWGLPCFSSSSFCWRLDYLEPQVSNSYAWFSEGP